MINKRGMDSGHNYYHRLYNILILYINAIYVLIY